MFRKHSDEIPELTLPKWPFILGDLLLVATALAIAILGNWQLTDWQVVACVLAVALGAALFVLPFIVEYLAREQENSSVSASQSALLARHVQELESRTAVMADQITRLGVNQAEAAKAQPPAAFDAAALRVIEDRLDRQAKQLEAAEENVKKIRAAQTTAQAASEKKAAPKPESKSEAKPASEIKTEPATKPASKPKPEPRLRKQADTQLLKRAIHDKQDRATQAVDRIIESKPTEDKKETPKAEPEEKKPEPLPEPTPKLETESKVEPEPEVKPAPEPAPKEAPKAETSKTEPAKAETKAPEAPKAAPESAPTLKPEPEPEHTPKTKPVPEGKAEAEAKPESVPEPEPESESKTADEPEIKAEAPTLFEADAVAPVTPQRRAKKNETRCTVNSLIGIGNKPYLRGSGGGLNWDSGIVMEFEAIGKWRWTPAADLEGPIELQVYRNDEDPDTSGKHTLQPGEALEINAKF